MYTWLEYIQHAELTLKSQVQSSHTALKLLKSQLQSSQTTLKLPK